MRPVRTVIGVLIAPCVAWSACLWAQTPERKPDAPPPATKPDAPPPAAKPDAPPPATIVRPAQLDVLSLQVSKLPRTDFGHGVKPGTNENVATWLANTGTAIDLRIKLDRPIAWFDERASRFVRFADDKGSDLARPPAGVAINSFFNDNKPILVKPGPGPDEAEVILRGFGTPAAGATKLQVHADLVFASGSDERTVERKGVEPTPGTRVEIGPLRLRFKDPRQVEPLGRLGPLGQPGPLGRLGPLGQPFRPSIDAPDAMRVAFQCEGLESSIKSLTFLVPEGDPVSTFNGRSFADQRGSTFRFNVPKTPRIDMRVVYFEKYETITAPIRLEMGVGF